MANKVFSYYKELPQWAKGVVVVGGIAIAYFTAKQIIARLRSQKENQKLREAVISQKVELDNLLKTGARLSYQPSQYKVWASQIVNEFKGCDPTDSSFAMLGNIIGKLKNDADFLALTTAFDVQEYPQCLSWFNSNFKGNLQQAVTDELTNKQIQIINNTLRDLKISYRF